MAGELLKLRQDRNVLNVDHTPGAAVAAGDAIVVNSFVFIAHSDMKAGELGSVSASGGVWEGISDGTNVGSASKLYLNAGKLGASGTLVGRELPDNTAAIADGSPIRFIFDPDGTSV